MGGKETTGKPISMTLQDAHQAPLEVATGAPIGISGKGESKGGGGGGRDGGIGRGGGRNVRVRVRG